MTYLLDTNTVSHIVRHRSTSARQTLKALSRDRVASVSAITEAEILYGLAKNPEARTLRAYVEDFLSRIDILPWGRREAAVYGLLRARLQATGKTLSNLDMLIAAHTVATNAILVTSDKAFRHVKELRGLEDWATDL